MSSVGSYAAEMKISYDPLFVTARGFMAASLLVNSVVPGLAPRRMDTTIYTSKLPA